MQTPPLDFTSEVNADNTSLKQSQSKKHVDFLYDPQLSLLAKTAIKLLPIAEELEKLLVKESFEDLNNNDSNKQDDKKMNAK